MEAQLCHILAHFLGDKHHEVYYVLGLTRKPFAEDRVLSRHTDRAGVEMTHAHHDAARSDQR
jgi:hypothetical protein